MCAQFCALPGLFTGLELYWHAEQCDLTAVSNALLFTLVSLYVVHITYLLVHTVNQSISCSQLISHVINRLIYLVWFLPGLSTEV